MQTLLTLLSYIALFVLMMPGTISGIVQAFLVFLPGLVLILWMKPHAKTKWIPSTYFLGGAALTAPLGIHFYSTWLPSSRLAMVGEMVNIPARFLLLATTATLCILSILTLSGLLRQGARLWAESGKKPLVRDLFCCFIASGITVVLAQIMIEVRVFSMGIINFLFGVLAVAAVIGALYCLLGRMRLSIVLGSGIFMLISTINAYVFLFRGRLFEPVDVFSVGTAMNVADNYSLLPIPRSILLGWGIFAVLFIFVFRKSPKTKHALPGKKRLLLALCSLLLAFTVFGYTTTLRAWNWQKEGAFYNGYLLDFVCKFRQAFAIEPEGYSKESVEELYGQYELNTDAEKKPHIIVIMNESFSDLSVIGEISTDKPVMPFISSIKDNAVSGSALVSIFGGNTANSEYEFLTGNTMAWLSPNAVPYQQYIRSSSYSAVSYLKSQYGYRCIAMHPYFADSWNRPKTYTNLGFDEAYFLEDFPQEDYLRGYVSDREMYQEVIRIFEEKKDDPLFLFGVTMQNHGSYDYAGENYTQSVSLVGYDREYPDVEQYLSLLHETDKATQQLISYFENVDEDVVIVFFGDHQPKIDTAFYDMISPDSTVSLNGRQNRYKVPFFVWANYDIPEAKVSCTSLSYLSSYMYEAAGIPLPPYNQFLKELEEQIPAINANGFYSISGKRFISFDKAEGEELEWLKQYKILQHNNVFDSKHRSEDFFPLP